MYFDSWIAFLTMEGHGPYVWSAYAIALLVIIYNLVAPLQAKRRVVAQIRRQERLAKNSEQHNRTKSESFGTMQRGAQ